MILKYPNNMLRIKCKHISKIDKSVIKDLKKLYSVVKSVERFYHFGLGMAANQIGITKRLVVLKIVSGKYLEMINPKIVSSYIPFLSLECCFSLPKTIKVKNRKLIIKVKYQDVKGKYHLITLFGPNSFVMQQEIDHLNGRLIID